MRVEVRATKKYVVLRFTHKQLRALEHALGNSVDYPDVMDALFIDGRERQRAYEAAARILDGLRAIAKAETPSAP